MPLQYLGVGLSKTGTTSLCAAMKMLGIRALHWEPQRLGKIVLGENNDPDFKIYDDCEFMGDIPHAYFHREIGRAYPGLKYILTERSEDQWFQSMCKHYTSLPKRFKPHEIQEALGLLMVVYGIGTFEDVPKRPFLLKKRFHDWNADIKLTIPPDDLLVMNICDKGDGWDKLCPFVGKDRPNDVFPHKNKS